MLFRSKLTQLYLYDNIYSLGNFFKNTQQVIMLSSDSSKSTSTVLDSNGECGVILGSINTGDATNGEYGSPYDTFISTLYNTKGLNLVSTDITDQPTTSGGFFKFYIGCSPDQGAVGNKTHIKIKTHG